jgi:hypothetical protein
MKEKNHHDLLEKIQVINSDIYKSKSIEKRLKIAEQLLEEKQSQLTVLLHEMKMEEIDVKRLQAFSFTSIYYQLFGDKDVQLSKENEEYLSAKLKYDNCMKAIDRLNDEISHYHSEISRRENNEVLLDDLQNQLVNILRANDNNEAKDLISKISQLELNHHELMEAKEAGETVLGILSLSIDSIESAKSWGMFDMIAGGMISTAIKHIKIDDAESYYAELQLALQKYKKELGDIDFNHKDVSIQIDTIFTVADYIFDGIIIDAIVQSKINKTREKLYQLNDEINEFQNQIMSFIMSNTESLIECKRNRDILVNQAFS